MKVAEKRPTPYQKLAESVIFQQQSKGIQVKSYNKQELELVGFGRSAYVFRMKRENKALKVFYPPYELLAKEEAHVYQLLKGIPYYPNLYEHGKNFIVIDYIKGMTLFECLVKGKEISSKVLTEVDLAIDAAKERGLNPSDIHLHNILITESEKVKLIDVVRFTQKKSCTQWNDLKKGYYLYYSKKYFPKKLPAMILLLIAYFYKKNLLKYLIARLN
ncbi:hypothetical protein FIU87_05950 [Bacillus sp. THAF10]|uniref:protein kinase family protein n=1 Tax=Bacillus sp. THAF10 TaxID=2587848 RepID=UPI001269264D|nr:protein kinase family protein [Bacillus sp. THAF10]QFT88176.1 hypothetical protein FIU87_05950 [Bacillus sp. THAF10]